MTIRIALIDTLKQAARSAGELLREGYHAAGTIDFEAKGASDFVTHYDRASEHAIIETVRRTHPGVGFIGEESGTTAAEAGDLTVIIDPLDGTNNFLHRVPHFSVSIAVREGGVLTHGVVYQPLLDEMLVATCLPYHAKGDCPTSVAQLTLLMPRVVGIRVPGSAALEIAYAGLGRFDAFWSQGARLDLWDVAAGIVIAREAGCTVTDLAGDPDPAEWNSLLVAHPERHDKLRGALQAH
ncbi:inositol monophosphatase family protein [Halomonas piscis]|uniref:Inositol-1-monophosphatase n=1 Tax=Halomonas piscis TaxID=3031727 RepID=A0ABY9YZI1_9GAMM|nr:inositol monophosphatase family protein [Halomonas piscis]WNK20274.1 inositol monophosphatase family protein [Halomonas piscis]